MNMHRPIKTAAPESVDARRKAADRAIVKARAMQSHHVGYASDILIAERRAAFWEEEAKHIRLHG